MRFRIRFKVSIIAVMLLIVTATTMATLINVWVVSSRTAKLSAGNLFDSVAENARVQLDRLTGEALYLANLVAIQDQQKTVVGNGLDAPSLPFLLNILQQNATLYSLYFGFADGNFLQVISVGGEQLVLGIHKAPDRTRWIIRTITNRNSDETTGNSVAPPSQKFQTWTFLDKMLVPIGSRIDQSFDYDPRKRTWYERAMAAERPQLSAPYIFNSLKQPGLSASMRLDNEIGVFGVDFTLSKLSDFISALDISTNGGVILSDGENRIISMSSLFGSNRFLAPLSSINSAPVQAVEVMSKRPAGDQLDIIEQDGIELLVRQITWLTGGRRLRISVVAPMADFNSHIRTMQQQIVILVLLGLGLMIPFVLVITNRMSKSISELAIDADRMRDLDFSGGPPRPSRILEFHKLGKSFSMMKSTLLDRTSSLEISENKLNRLVDLGIAMSAEHDSNKLMDMVILGAKELSNADGGTLYIIGDDGMLHFQIVHLGGQDNARDWISENKANFPPVALFDDTGNPNRRNVVSYSVHEGQTVNIADAYDTSSFDFSGTRVFDERNNYRSTSFLTVPLKPRGGSIIGALQLINARAPGTETPMPFSVEIQRFIEALAAQAATALYNRDLLDAQERLMDGMIELIAGAIDTKSPYTGGHCARVPELAIMLAEEACQADKGTLADFRFDSDEEWREFRIGAWLHDCGKVVTPEFVVDKATKLETIYNRIHEVRMRFEVLLRDAKIEQLEARAAGTSSEMAQDQYDRQKSRLMDEFAFIASNNIGSEYMEEETITRLNVIANRTWQRHFDDRLGLSHFELERHGQATPQLPVTEKLLDDKPRHIIRRKDGDLNKNADLGFKMKVPEHIYNQGEIINLSIRRGTLSEEERYKINEHITQTIAMLEHLPFPKQLQRVPEYAGTHHEMLNGQGYPRELSGNELSVPARIMAIADIFEALTASDRPYKKAKSLSEAIRILSFFKQDGHIDPELFDLFLTSGVYRRYAKQFLDPALIDDVDIEQYITVDRATASMSAADL